MKIGSNENGKDSRKGAPYAISTVPYPLTDGKYDPSTASTKDLVQACSFQPKWTIAPSFSFAGYCMEDLVFPDAWDDTKTLTIHCPVQNVQDNNGKNVRAPGIVCVQGNDTDATQLSNNTTI